MRVKKISELGGTLIVIGFLGPTFYSHFCSQVSKKLFIFQRYFHNTLKKESCQVFYAFLVSTCGQLRIAKKLLSYAVFRH